MQGKEVQWNLKLNLDKQHIFNILPLSPGTPVASASRGLAPASPPQGSHARRAGKSHFQQHPRRTREKGEIQAAWSQEKRLFVHSSKTL